MREKIMIILLWVLCLLLLALSARQPVNGWVWPCYSFSLAVCLFLLPDVAKILAGRKGRRDKENIK